jgi:hypothetical protein
MSHINDFKQFVNENYMVSESVSLTQNEKDFLWGKMETKKKATAKEKENDIYQVLQGSKKIEDETEFIKILNSLEYSMKKRVKTGEAPKGKYEDAFNSLQKKLPSDWKGVLYSNLKAKNSRDEKVPTSKSTKKTIIDYLNKKNIKFDESDTKEVLVKKIK